jgi:hypothetical protein
MKGCRLLSVWWGVKVRQVTTGIVHSCYHARIYSDGSIACWPAKDMESSFGWSKGGWEMVSP